MGRMCRKPTKLKLKNKNKNKNKNKKYKIKEYKTTELFQRTFVFIL
jgi:hypothetical protein